MVGSLLSSSVRSTTTTLNSISRAINIRKSSGRILITLLFCLSAIAFSSAQVTVSVSPVALSFGIPTGTPAPLSFTSQMTVNIIGTGTVNLSSFAVTGTYVNGQLLGTTDFVINGNSCTTPQTAPTTCQISVQFTSTQPAGTLETATLSFNTSATPGSITVPLSGAYGAISLFDETNVTVAPSSASPTNLYTIANKTLNLSCPANPTATISGTPDGSGYVLVDDYLTLQTGTPLVPVNNATPPGNVCNGFGDSESGPFACFTLNYLLDVFQNPDPLLGLDPDSFANPGNGILPHDEPQNGAGGVPPISVGSFLTPSATLQTLITLQSSGGEGVYDNSTLFLATNCSAGGIIPGSSVTLNPVDTNNPQSQTQTAVLDNSPGQNISFTTSVSAALQNDPNILTSGVVPIVTDFGIPQQLFYQLVSNANADGIATTGTSAAPAVCVRLAGELDYSVTPPAPMCKGYLLQCYNPTTGTTSGDNCSNASSELANRFLLYTAQFTSPDEPSGYNYLTTAPWQPSTPYAQYQTVVDSAGFVQQVATGGTSGSSYPFTSASETVGAQTSDGSVTWTNQGVNACLSQGPGIACAQGTGPAMLMGSDYWLCAGGGPCGQPAVTTTTPIAPPTFSPSNCVLTGGLTGALCPLDVLTFYAGAADAARRSTSTGGNSLFIPVANMPLPTTTTAVTGISGTNTSGWINTPSMPTGWSSSPTITATFTANPATYQGTASNPPANGFTQAATYSVTGGLSTYPTVPDTTYPISTDTTQYNSSTQALTPFCNIGGTTPLSFTAPPTVFNSVNGNPIADGLYNLHYFTTDCAFTEGLVFSPTPPQLSDPTANWASFPFVTVGVDTVAPTYTCNPPSPSGSGWYYSNPSIPCTVTDQDYTPGVTGSGFLPLVSGIQGSQTETVYVSTNVPAGTVNPAAYSNTVSACDLAGNCVNVQAGPFMVSNAPQLIITASSSSMTFGGTVPTITPSYSGLVGGEAAPSTPPTCSTTATSSSPVASYPSSCIGASDSTYNYSISYVPGTVTVIQAAATIALSNLSQVYTGHALSPTVTTTPPGLAYTLTGGGDTNVGSYQVSATITNPNYSGSTGGTFVIGQAAATIALSNLNQVYTGHALSPTVTTTPPGLAYSLTGGGDTNAGSYQVTATITNPNYSGSTSGTFVIGQAPATITLSNLSQVYTGSPLSPTVTTVPSGLGYSLTGAPDTAQGSYQVSATITNANYSGSTSGTFVITAPAVWTITPSSYYFGEMSVGQSASQTFVIRNPGPIGVAIQVSIPGANQENPQPPGDPDDFRIVNGTCGKTLAAGASCDITVKFIADSDDPGLPNGNYANLAVMNSKGTVLVQAQMTAKVVNPVVSLSTNSFNFGAQQPGTSDNQFVATLTNSGPTTFLLQYLTVNNTAGNAFRVGQGTTCTPGAAIASGSTCKIYVTFSPAKHGQSYAGNVVVRGNATTMPSMSLSGTGAPNP